MNDLVSKNGRIQSMSQDAIDQVKELETIARFLPNEAVHTHHVIHNGQYARTVKLKAGTLITGALIKKATILIVSGDCSVSVGDKSVRYTGYSVLAASAYRKQAFLAHADTYLTMIFATDARSVRDAEDEFTDDGDLLISRSELGTNEVLITGE